MADSFHEHLDHCKQCKEHPFGLCITGTVLLQMQIENDRKEVDNEREKDDHTKEI